MKKIYCPLFCCDIYIFNKERPEAVDKFIRSKTDDEHVLHHETAGAQVSTLSPYEFCLIIWSKFDDATLTHECLHLAARILRFRKIVLGDQESEEIYGYYIEYLFREIKKALKGKNT